MNLYNYSDAVKHHQSTLAELTPNENERNKHAAEDTVDAKDSGDKQYGSTHCSKTASRNAAESQTFDTKMPATKRNVASSPDKLTRGDDSSIAKNEWSAASSDGLKWNHVACLPSGHDLSLFPDASVSY